MTEYYLRVCNRCKQGEQQLNIDSWTLPWQQRIYDHETYDFCCELCVEDFDKALAEAHKIVMRCLNEVPDLT